MQREKLFQITGMAMVAFGLFLTVLSALDGSLRQAAGWLFYTLCGGAILYEVSYGFHIRR